MAINISLEKLLETGAHFGHQTRRWNPKIKPYLFGEEKGVHIFDLIKTKEALEQALTVLKEKAKKGKSIVFVGSKKQVKEVIEEVAKKTDSFYVNERWLGGTITNFDQIKKTLKKLEEMKQKRKEGGYKSLTKKERLLIDREIARMERFFGGLKGLDSLPHLLVIVDLKKEKGAALEARKKGIETIGIVDSNSDPELVDYPVPMNDDASKALKYVLELMGEAIKEGRSGSKTTKEKTKTY